MGSLRGGGREGLCPAAEEEEKTKREELCAVS